MRKQTPSGKMYLVTEKRRLDFELSKQKMDAKWESEDDQMILVDFTSFMESLKQ